MERRCFRLRWDLSPWKLIMKISKEDERSSIKMLYLNIIFYNSYVHFSIFIKNYLDPLFYRPLNMNTFMELCTIYRSYSSFYSSLNIIVKFISNRSVHTISLENLQRYRKYRVIPRLFCRLCCLNR